MDVRWANASDYDSLGEVMFAAVRTGFSRDSESQRLAWVPEPPSGEAWHSRLVPQNVAMAEKAGVAQGFISLRADGYIDLAFIRPESQGTGLFRRLFDIVQDKALEAGVDRLWTHASLMARPAFSAMQFSVIKKETVEVRSETLERYEMEKKYGVQRPELG